MSTLPRIGVVDFVQTHLPFMPQVERALQGRAEFCYFQPQSDIAALRGSGARLWVLERTAAQACAMDDAELLQACGRQQLLKWDSVPALLARARMIAERLQTFLVESRVEVLMLWNGAPLMAALAQHLGRRRGLRLMYLENGYLPGTMQIAREGVNACNEFGRRIAAGEYLQFQPDEAALDAMLVRLRSGAREADAVPVKKPGPSLPRKLLREFTRLFGASAWRWTGTVFRGGFHRALPPDLGPFVLLPLQVMKDSQLQLHSPLVGNDMPRLILETYASMRSALPRHRLVVKLHPKESAHRRRRYLDIARKLPDVVFLDGQAMHRLLPQCDLLVTVNSTAGVEALAFGKPVVALGRNFYVDPALLQVVEALDELPLALRAALDRPKPAEVLRRFLGYLHQVVLTRGSHLDLSPRSIEAVSARILALALEGAP